MIVGLQLRRAGLLSGALLFAAAVATSTRAEASEASCTTQHASGQREVLAGHLKVGSEQLAACGADAECPAVVRAECFELLANAERLMPTVIFSVSGADGMQIPAVKVFSNDELITERLDGTPIALDPGKHRFRFVLPSGEVTSTDVLIREGEKGKVITLTSGEPDRMATPAPLQPGFISNPPLTQSPFPPPVTPVIPPSTTRHQLPTSFWVASGVGAAAVLSFATFALLGRSIHSDLANCSPNCGAGRHGDFDALGRNYLLADLSLAVAGVSAGAAAYLYFSSTASQSRVGTAGSRAGLHVAVVPPSSKSKPAMLAITRTF